MHYLRVSLLLMALALCASHSIGADDQRGRDLALCVGVSAYQKYPSLSIPGNDARELAGEFTALGNFHRVIVLSDLDAEGDANQARFLPTGKNIMDMLTLLSRTSLDDSTIVVYLSGYGILEDGTVKFLPVDAEEDGGIPLDELVAVLASSKAKAKYVIMDAGTPLFSGTAPIQDSIKGDVTVIFSHEGEQRPLTDDEGKRGLFRLAMRHSLLALGDEAVMRSGELISGINRFMSEHCLDRDIMAGQSASMVGGNADATFLKTGIRTESSFSLSSLTAPVHSSASSEKKPAVASVSESPGIGGKKAENLCLRGREHLFAHEFAEALSAFTEAASLSDPEAENWLGNLYFDGFGVSRDLDIAVEHYQRGIELGSASACAILGFLREIGSTTDGGGLDEGIALYERAVSKGNPFAMWRLGRLYRDGRGVSKDEGRAAQLFQGARDAGLVETLETEARAGLTRSQYSLGMLYLEGVVIPESDMRKAADQLRESTVDSESSYRQLGDHFYEGSGATQNYGQAATMYRSAAEETFKIAK